MNSNFGMYNWQIVMLERAYILLCGVTRQAMRVQHNIEARSLYHCCCEKAIKSTYSECVSVALVIQHGVRMRRVKLSPVTCSALSYLSTLSHKRHDFWTKFTERKCVF
jgi:hypothetical protein